MHNFIHIPKVAGSSLYALIGGGRPVNYCGHTRVVDLPFFCFVRNPYDRLVDAYFYLVKGGGGVEPDTTYYNMLQKYRDFNDFVFNIEKDNLLDIILHIKPMSYYICDDNMNVLVKNIFKIEEPEKIDDFLNSIGIGKLSEVRVNIAERNDYTEYLTKENTQEINRLYKKDFELFGYEYY